MPVTLAKTRLKLLTSSKPQASAASPTFVPLFNNSLVASSILILLCSWAIPQPNFRLQISCALALLQQSFRAMSVTFMDVQ